MKKLRMYLNKNVEGGLKNANNNVAAKSRVNNTNNSKDNFWS